MIRLLILGLSLCASSWLSAQQPSCCTPARQSDANAHAAFAELGNDPTFRGQHALPQPFELHDARWRRIAYATPDGDSAHAWLLPAATESDDYLFLFHEWWGLNDYVKAEATTYHDTLGGQVNMLCLDLYDGQVADSREEARTYMQSVTQERAEGIIRGAVQHVADSAAIATIGWCFGGGWSLQASLLLGEQAAGCVMYYGMPVQEVARLRDLTTSVLGIFARQDGWITPEVVGEFEANMKAANQALRVEMYDANHAFANPSSPRHDEEAARKAFRVSAAFLRLAFGLE